MIKPILQPKKSQVYGIKLHVVNTTDFRGQFSGTSCNSVMALSIRSCTGYADQEGNVSDTGKTPVSLAYLWYLAAESVDGNTYILIGRTMEELHSVLNDLAVSSAYQGMTHRTLADKPMRDVLDQIRGKGPDNGKNDHMVHTMRVYIHGLGIEFQTLRNIYNDRFAEHHESSRGDKYATFSRQAHSPMYALVHQAAGDCDIKFVDSMSLIKKDLPEWCKDENIPIDIPMEAPINGIITPITKLTEEDLEYGCMSTAAVVMGMQKQKEKFGNRLDKIPLTQTGIVRNIIKSQVCQYEPWGPGEKHKKDQKATGSRWSRKCAEINRTTTPDEYARFRQIFTGGSVVINPVYSGRLIKNVMGYDFSSDYMGIMSHMLFPVGKFETVKKNEAKIYLNKDNILDFNRKIFWYAHFEFRGLRMKKDRVIPYWQDTKCIEENSFLTDKYAGKIISAKDLDVYMTDIDWYIFKRVYEWDSMKCTEMWGSEAGLLPCPIIRTVLEIYRDKTHYKGNEDELSKYNEAKQFGSSIYGAAVTRLFDDQVVFTEEGWKTIELDQKLFDQKIKSITPKNTFLPYQVGVWVAAWGRFNLWQFIIDMEKRVIYGDTDSMFGKFTEEDKKRFKDWEDWMDERRKKICTFYPELEEYMYRPTKPDDTHANLGAFELDHEYVEYKVIGLKRYAGSYMEDGELKLKVAIAGLPKAAASAHIKKPNDISTNLTWNVSESKLTTPTFNEEQGVTKWKDRDGKVFTSKQKYGVAIVPSTFTLSTKSNVSNFINFMNSDMWCNMGRIDASDPIFIKKALDKSLGM